jgi:FtsZ-binding cell division protein ZapB
MSPSEQETDALSGLEERIQKAVQLVNRLREERDAALAETSEARAENAQLADEVKNLQAERRQVRTRIEKLLGQIDGLSAG